MTDRQIPAALAAQPHDRRRGLPIPYAQHRRDVDEPGAVNEADADFAVIDAHRMIEVAHRRLCAVCGEPLGYWIAFLGGPVSAASREYVDGPMHEECALAAMTLCPHMAHPGTRRASEARLRVDTVVPDGWVATKPSEFVLYLTRDFTYTIRPVNGGQGAAGVFKAAAPKSLRRFAWDDTGTLVEQNQETP